MSCYDRGIGTPLILRWPGRIPAGTVNDGLVSTVDIMPTLLEAAGCAIPETVQGTSVLSLATGENGGPINIAVVAEMTYHVSYLPVRAIRTCTWKYIRNYSDDAIGLDQLAHVEWAHRLCKLPNQSWLRLRVPEELYFLGDDPHEQHNLAGEPAYERELKRMRSLMDRHMRETRDPLLGRRFERNYTGEGLIEPEGKRYFQNTQKGDPPGKDQGSPPICDGEHE